MNAALGQYLMGIAYHRGRASADLELRALAQESWQDGGNQAFLRPLPE